MTTNLFDTLAQAAEVLARLGKDWALVGGLAVSTYVEPRFTRDIDIVVAVDDDQEAEQFAHAWTASGFVIHFASSGIEPEVTAEALRLEIAPGVVVPVAGLR